MLPNIINKVVFELHCKNESTAGVTSRKLLHSRWPEINQLINRVLEKYSNSSNYYRFDKVELDLGNISSHAIDEDEFLFRVQYMLEEQLNQVSQQREIATAEQTDWEMLKTWLLLGDLPWWVDKKSNPDLSIQMKNVFTADPERVIHFIREHRHTPSLIRRLRPIAKELNIDLIIHGKNIPGEVVPQSGVALSARFVDDFENNRKKKLIKTVTTRQLLNLIFAINKQDDRQKSLPAKKFNTAEKELKELLKKDTTHTRERLATMLKTISSSALEKILSENQTQVKKAGTPFRTTIQKKKLLKLLHEWKASGKHQSKVISEMITDGRLFQHQILTLFNEHPTGFRLIPEDALINPFAKKFNGAWIQAAKDLRGQVRKLTDREQQQYSSLLNNDYVTSRPQLALVKKILSVIKSETLDLILFLTRLPKEEINRLSGIPEEEDQLIGQLLIDNAGLCLIANYLPPFLSNLGFIENGQFKTQKHATKAVQLLEYMAFGKNKNPEYRVQLNKLLCGLSPQETMIPGQRLKQKEYKEADDLLKAVINNWASLKNTSPDGFRSAFLQRKGVLNESPKSWVLRVEKAGMDVLLDSLPWNYSMIRLPWMQKMIEVEW